MMDFLRTLFDVITAPLRALLSAPRKLVEGSRSLSRLSLPAQVAIFTAVFLVVCAVLAVLAFLGMNQRAFWWTKLTPTFVVVVLVLIFAIPLVLYQALRVWLEGEVSPFPDIDRAWRAGLDELARQGIDPCQVPLFMILGTAGARQEKALFDASRLELSLHDVPAGPAPLHWYAGPEGVYLACGGAGCLSRAANLAAAAGDADKARGPGPAPKPQNAPLGGTILLDRSEASARSSARPVAAEGPPGNAATPNIYGTMLAGGSGVSEELDTLRSAWADKQAIKLDQQEAADQERRLEYVCRLLRRLRQPFCPINGILTLLPFGLMQRSTPEANEVERAVRKDLGVVQRMLKLRCPVTAMVVGLEEEHGFRELVRRVGRDRAAQQRFGKGYEVSNPPLGERLEALAIHACGAFEDWVYTLFRERDALSKPGNNRLFTLLCKIRRTVQKRLVNILANGYACDSEGDVRKDGLLFSGCYFAGTGETEDRQAFVAAVVQKLSQQQEELEWTEAGLREDAQYQFLGQLVLLVDTVLLVALVATVVWLFWWRKV